MTVTETSEIELANNTWSTWPDPVDDVIHEPSQSADKPPAPGLADQRDDSLVAGSGIAGTPIGELVDGLRHVWEHSVDELDASVSLEADGVNDSVAANRFGVRDVAELAEQLTSLVPARVSSESHDPPEKAIPYLRLACRGLLFGIPGLFYLVVAWARPSPAASYTMVIAMLAGWGLSQGIALVAYRLLGRAGGPAAALALRRIMIGALAAASLALLIAAILNGLWLVSLATGQVLYVVAATILLFYNADRLLGAALVPGALVSAAYLAGLPIPSPAALATIVATVAAVCAAAFYRAHAGIDRRAPASRLVLTDIRASGPYILQGVLSGVAVAYIPVRMLSDGARPDVHAVDLSIVPLVLCMGFAEIELLRLRASSALLMRRTGNLRAYQRGIVGLVLLSQLRFLIVLVSASVIVGATITLISELNARDRTLLSAYAVLGTALLAALLLAAVDRVKVALFGFLSAGCVIAVSFVLAQIAGMTPSVEGGYLASCLILLIALTILALRTLRDPKVLA